MSAFNGLVFTTKGKNLQGKVQAGAVLHFTRIALGYGELGGSLIADLTALKNEVKSLSIAKLKSMSGGKAVVGGVFTNDGLLTGFYWRELGVFATDPDLGEILYCYGNAGAIAEYIPPGGGADILERTIDVIVLTANAASITATIDQSLIYATQADIVQLTEDISTINTTIGGLIKVYISVAEPIGIKENDLWLKEI